MSDDRISSYQKGINRLLENKAEFEKLIIEYLLFVNSKYRSNMFPTPQIAKILLEKLNMKKTQFPIIHKIVRTILEEWTKHGWCEYVSTTKSGRNRRTKFIYKFNPENMQFLKGRFISSSITEIEHDIVGDGQKAHADTMMTRDAILDDWVNKVHDLIDEIDAEAAEPEDKDAWEE